MGWQIPDPEFRKQKTGLLNDPGVPVSRVCAELRTNIRLTDVFNLSDYGFGTGPERGLMDLSIMP
ncbi:MAG: hypothetical protein U1B80_05540, partial [Anaerolineaceae bacterium]|nr:hypothetical protein [Anaerolineaceae bacterium]